MTDITDAIGAAFAGILGQPALGVAGRFLALAVVVLWVASAWWAWRDMALRSDEPLYRYLATAGIVLATPFLFPLALLVYGIVRPPIRDEPTQALEQRLEELALGASPDRCPRCTAHVARRWRRCPACGQVLSVPCPGCGEPVGLDWQLCAWCAAELPWTPGHEPGSDGPAPVAIPIRPGGRPRVPVMAVPARRPRRGPST